MPLAAGVYTRVRNWLADANAAPTPINIEPGLHDSEDDSIAAALNLAVYRDGQVAYTANQSMGGFKFTNLANGSADADSVSLGQANGLYLLKAQLGAGLPVNASITSSVASNALTINLKTAAGADASSASPVLLSFRSATATDGAITVVAVTAASSLVISSGSTLGASNATSFRVWIVAFNDAGTVRLGAIRAVSGTNIRQLATFELVSSTAEGGAGAADSAQVFYTGTAVTSKAYCMLGYLTWNTGLTTAGTWNADADVKQTYGAGVPLPGMELQRPGNSDGAVATGTTVMPFDDTIPQNTEGDQYMSQAVTPLSQANILEPRFELAQVATTTANGGLGVALFQDSTANALCAHSFARDAATGNSSSGVLQHRMLAATASATTFKIRMGVNGAGTTTFNGSASGRIYGGVNLSTLAVAEYMG